MQPEEVDTLMKLKARGKESIGDLTMSLKLSKFTRR